MPPARPEVRGVLRGVRAAMLATAALALAAAAHVGAGGTLPPLPVLCLLLVPLAWGAVALTARPLGRVALTVGLGGGQVALHEALMVLSVPTCGPLTTTGGMAGMHAARAGGTSSALASCAGHAMSSPSVVSYGAGAMFVAHAAATVLTALLLARGERALARLLNAPLRRLAAAVGMGPRRATAVVRTADGWRHVVRLASAVLDGAGGRRGPPVWSAAATR